jgi:uncharacterized protein
MKTLQTHSDRLHIVDALRGFALLGIVAVHFMEQYFGRNPPSGYSPHSSFPVMDQVFDTIFFILVRGKFFALFSFLFGLSFVLQMQHAETRAPESDFRWRFAWRLVVLLAIGFVHNLFYCGDILTVFALLGFPLLLFYKVSTRWLLVSILLLMLSTPRIIMKYAIPKPTLAEQKALEQTDSLRATKAFEVMKKGSFPEIAYLNATDGLRFRMDSQFAFFGRGYQTFAYFLMGLWAGRRRIFDDMEKNWPIFKKMLKWGGIATVALPLLSIAIEFLLSKMASTEGSNPETSGGQNQAFDPTSWQAIFGMTLYDVWNFSMMFFYVGLFVWLYRKVKGERFLSKFAPVGKMALTSYVSQTLIGTFIFFGFGLGKLGDFGSSETLAMGLVVFIGQMYLSRWWLARFNYGPLEWLWRSITFWAWQPFVKKTEN